ncbi:rhomboid family intramembrane serine protease [Paenibacillus sp. J31TS4]|uniref:rhomboid family intramembrane serine protease n=1 Tax=Paenibacillus sp. J31TS4 TaxID=2807195 RepID=UPI001B16DCB8|nr:rhomboid family intramembrane serine protease [Paenibacillus sp. J31TS4]GIP37650.1 rhomboid family intramembrane serine protease [Paenibacillus sp. J31TS4]
MVFLRNETIKQYLRWYPVNALLVIGMLIVFLVMEAVGSTTDQETLLRFGAMFKVQGLEPEWWRYITAVFLHIGWSHLLFNLFSLYVFAPPLERLLGHIGYLFFFLITGVLGNALSYWLTSDDSLSAGASGAIYGVFGAYLFLGLFRKELFDRQSKQTVVTILVVGLIYSLVTPQINLYAHLGGFLAGFAFAMLTPRRQHRGGEGGA